MKSIKERIDQETAINKELLQKNRKVEERIKELNYEINASVEENKKNNTFLNEAFEIKKFLKKNFVYTVKYRIFY